MRIIVTRLGNKFADELSSELKIEDYTNENNLNKKSVFFDYDFPVNNIQSNKLSFNNIISPSENYNSSRQVNNFFLTNNKNIDSKKNKINHNYKFTNNNKSDNSKSNFQKISVKYNNQNTTRDKIHKTRLINSMESTIKPDLFNVSKSISIKQKKLYLPKNLQEKYNADHNYGYMLPDLNLNNVGNNQKNMISYLNEDDNNIQINNIENNEFSNNNFSPNMKYKSTKSENQYKIRESFKIKEILNKKSFDDLTKKLTIEDSVKNRLKRVDENNFRSDYLDFSRLEKFENILNLKIKANKVALIKYINEKENISDLFLKKVIESSEEKRTRANKICQIIFNKQEKEKSANKILIDKIQEKKEQEISLYKINLEKMKNNLKDSFHILKDYNNISLNNNSIVSKRNKNI